MVTNPNLTKDLLAYKTLDNREAFDINYANFIIVRLNEFNQQMIKTST